MSTKRNEILIILISLFIFSFIWIGFSIYHSSVKSTIPEVVDLQLTQIDPNFDTQTIANLKKRQSVTPIYQLGTQGQNVTIPSSPSATFPISLTTITGSESSQQSSSQGGSLSQ